MDEADGSDNRATLDTWMNERRRELRIRWTQVAERAGMSPENLRKIRRGQIRISEDAADGLDIALEWAPGSVEAADKHGTKPEPRRDGVTASPADVLSREEYQRFQMARDFMRTQGRELTIPLWNAMRDEYVRLEEAERAPEPDYS